MEKKVLTEAVITRNEWRSILQKTMSRGEIISHVLLCGSEPTTTGTIYGLGLRKSFGSQSGWAKVVVTPHAISSFKSDAGNDLVLTIAARVHYERTFFVECELVNITTSSAELMYFTETDELQMAISQLLSQALWHTMFKYDGLDMVYVPAQEKEVPAFVFLSTNNNYTALTTTSKSVLAPGVMQINALSEPAFWRPTCFMQVSPFEVRCRVDTDESLDVAELQDTVKQAVLTFNASISEPEAGPIIYTDSESPNSLA